MTVLFIGQDEGPVAICFVFKAFQKFMTMPLSF